MNFTLALIRSTQQAIIKKFDKTTQEINETIIDLDSIDDEEIHALFYLPSEEEISLLMQKEAKFYPFIDAHKQGISEESFSALNFFTGSELFLNIYSQWILYNNVATIGEIFPTCSYLKDLWVNDRNSFLEELWFILKTNIGTSKLRIIFNDLAEEKNDKNTLCHSSITGSKMPDFIPGGTAETEIMKNYENSFTSNFEIAEYDPSKGELVILATVDKSPLLIMANIFTFNKIQKALVKSIIDGLQSAEN